MSEGHTFTLNHAQRVTLLDLLPQTGNYATMKVLESVKSDLAFDEDEVIEHQIVAGPNRVNWKTDSEKEVTFKEIGWQIVRAAIRKADRENRLNATGVTLFEMFLPDEVEGVVNEPAAEMLEV